MRYLVIVFFLLNLFFKTDAQVALQNSVLNDSTLTVSKKKPLLIGNVTELGWSYNWLFPNPLYTDSTTEFGTSNTKAFYLAQYFIINNIVFQAGLEYNIQATDFSIDYRWDSVYTSQIMVFDTVGTHYYIVNGQSVPEYVIDQHYVSQIDTEEKRISQSSVSKIHYLTIPVNIGYRWRYEKFALYAKLGARFNFFKQTIGKIYLANNHEWVQFDKKIENKFYYSASANVAFEYPFSSLCSFILEPEYRYSWYSKVNSGFAENHHQFGVRMGIQFWF